MCENRKTDIGFGFEDKTETETDANFKTEHIRFSKYNDIIIGFTIKQLAILISNQISYCKISKDMHNVPQIGTGTKKLKKSEHLELYV